MTLSLPPAARKEIKKVAIHGDLHVDEYTWLQDKESPQTKAYLEAENAYADGMMKPQKKLIGQLYKEMKARMREKDMSVPVKDGPYEYYTRVAKGKQYAIHCRRRIARGKEEIILDENALASGQSFFHLGAAQVSEDHRYLAYTIDTTGDERHELRIKDLNTGHHLPDVIEAVSDVEWSDDGAYLFYTKEQHPHPPRQLFRHTVGQPAGTGVLIYEEKDEQWYVGLSKSHDSRMLFISCGSFDSTEVRFLPADTPLEKPRLIVARQKRVKYGVEHHQGLLYVITNERAVEYKIMRTSVEKPNKKNWKTWMAHQSTRTIEGFVPFSGFFAVTIRENGTEHIVLTDADRSKERRVSLPEGEHSVSLWGDIEYASASIRFTYESLITPKTVYDYDVQTRKMTQRKRQTVPRWDPARFVSKRVWVKSGDVRVPVVLAHKKGLTYGRAPLLLEAYGSYGIASDPVFSITKSVLMDRGWIIALAHPRGGGEMGQKWHERAKKMTKHRTYEDVIAVADALVARKYVTRKNIALIGGSAGGMMVGAVLNMRPNLVGAAIAYVPAADTLTSMLDESLGGTRLHYDEIGDPRMPKEYAYIKKWSPYEGVHVASYPALLVRCSFHDIRTPYWESAKWVARLRAKKMTNSALMLKTEMSAGHFGKSGRYEWLKERAWDFAFLISSLAQA